METAETYSPSKRVRLSDVARQAGVHPATVSHVLANRAEARISAETRSRILAAVHSLGYVPNFAARTLATGRSNVVAVLTFDFQNSFSVEITRQLHELAGKAGSTVLSCMVDRDLGAVGAQVDGVIALDYSPEMAPPPKQGVYVSLGVYGPEDQDCCLIDFKPAAEEAMKLLIQQGRRKILYVTGVDPIHHTDPRESAYLEALATAGLPTQILEVPVGNRTCAYEGLSHFLSHQSVDAIICRNDALALGCLRALLERGVDVPGTTAIVGSDGTEDSQFTFPALSTLVVPFSAACEGAWNLFQTRLEDPAQPPRRLSYPATFAPRGTT